MRLICSLLLGEILFAGVFICPCEPLGPGVLIWHRVFFLTLFISLNLEGLLCLIEDILELSLIGFPWCIHRDPFQTSDQQNGLEVLPKYLSSYF